MIVTHDLSDIYKPVKQDLELFQTMIRDELSARPYATGTLGMALAGPDTGGSQWFVTQAPEPHLDGGYTVFGSVATGMDVVLRLEQGDRIVRVSAAMKEGG